MIPILILLAAQAATDTRSINEAHAAECAKQAEEKPEQGVELANQWRLAGGGFLARQCLGLAYAAQQRWQPAAVSFEQAAREAEVELDPLSPTLWVQAGNARLAANDVPAARKAFDSALASPLLTGSVRGEAHLDRARALVALNDPKAARVDLDQAVKLAPEDPLAWLLSATLARRQNDLDRASKDIAEAAKRSPDDASVALEAGNIAMLSGSPEAARVAWQGAITNQPGSPAAKAAQAALDQLNAGTKPEG